MLDPFRDRTAVITGGAAGIGAGLARAMAARGARLVLADVDQAALAATARQLEAEGAAVLAVPADVGDRAQVEALAEAAWKRFGGVHIVCNNAGVAVHGSLESATHRDWEWVLAVNLWGVIHGVEAFVPRMIAQKQPGHVVNTASMAGLIASQGLGVYNTSKYAVVGLSETLHKDLRPHDIGVSILCPMGVSTNIRTSERNRPLDLQNPKGPEDNDWFQLIGRYLEPEDVAGRVLRAVKANRLYVITHEEAREPLRRRFERMDKAFEESR
jgi:NAD(P)-dependent dehydrogenase (short-subunit alcohol dehydrogenase family)